ncbi:MAG TPA: hypothetical protein VFI73_07345 [Candidatus Nitrosopolaris sp.]|nr:hypothetical protein [Candidatus Nitrosopolaris sp.]
MAQLGKAGSDALEELAYEWKRIQKMKRLVQELCEKVGGNAVLYVGLC